MIHGVTLAIAASNFSYDQSTSTASTRMNGEFLAHVSQAFLNAHDRKYSKEQLLEEVKSVIDKCYDDDTGSLQPIKNNGADVNKLINSSLANASSEDISRLSVLLPWSAPSQCSQFLIGFPYNAKKRTKLAAIPDTLVKELDNIVGFNQKHVIESGCFEGIHSVSMAMLGAQVYGFDVRIENVLKSIVRSWAYGQASSTCFDLLNIENTSISDFYNTTYPDLDVDFYHCRGVLYHLKKPYEYCAQIAALNPAFIYFHTQVASNEQANEAIETPLGSFKFFNYREKGRVSPFAGVEDCAKWFTASSLKSFMAELGYRQVVFERLKEERNGLRLQILLTR